MLQLSTDGRRPDRPKDFQWLSAAHNPRGKHHIGIAQCVIGMEMSEKQASQVGRIQRR